VFRELDEGFEDRIEKHLTLFRNHQQIISFLVKNEFAAGRCQSLPALCQSSQKRHHPQWTRIFRYVLAIPNKLKIRHRLYFDMLRRILSPICFAFLRAVAARYFSGEGSFAPPFATMTGICPEEWMSEQLWIRAHCKWLAAYGRRCSSKTGQAARIEYEQFPPWLRSDGRDLPKTLCRTRPLAVHYLATCKK